MRSAGRGRLARVLTTPLGSVGAALLAAALLLQGLGVAGIAQLAGLPGLSLLSSSGPLGGLAPLSDEFVRRVLGLPSLTSPPRAPSPTPVSTAFVTAGSPKSAGHDAAATRPVTVEHAFDNDDFASARRIPSVPYSATTDTTGEHREPGEPTSCAPVGGTAWYRFDAPIDQALFADTFGTKYADSLGVFTGTSLQDLTQVSCGSSTSGAAQTGFLARRGESYWFQLAGTIGGGPLSFHLVPVGVTDTVARNSRVWHALSADGRVVAFAGTPQGPGSGAQVCPHSGGATVYCEALYVADLSTGRVRLMVSTHPEATAFQDLETNAVIQYVSASRDGRYVAFTSDDSQLVPRDTNLVFDVFVLDTVTGRVERASVASDGSQAAFDPTSNTETSNQPQTLSSSPGSQGSTISADGRWVNFTSDANNLVSGDSGGAYDVFVHDRLTGRTRLVSVGADGRRFADGGSVAVGSQVQSADGSRVVFEHYRPSFSLPPEPDGIWVFNARSGRSTQLSSPRFPTTGYTGLSADGSTLAFYFSPGSQREGLVAVDVHDLRHPVYAVVSANTRQPQSRTVVFDSEPKYVASYVPFLTLSATGRYIAFAADAAGVVPGDTNSVGDVFVRDTRRASTVRISVTSAGGEYTTESIDPFLSADGRDVLFYNNGALLVHRSIAAGAP